MFSFNLIYAHDFSLLNIYGLIYKLTVPKILQFLYFTYSNKHPRVNVPTWLISVYTLTAGDVFSCFPQVENTKKSYPK